MHALNSPGGQCGGRSRSTSNQPAVAAPLAMRCAPMKRSIRWSQTQNLACIVGRGWRSDLFTRPRKACKAGPQVTFSGVRTRS